MNEVAYMLSTSSVPVKPPTILLVDDDRVMLMVLQQGLEGQGYTVIPAKSGDEALAALRSRGPEIDTIILDREMPDMNGMQIVSKIKADRLLASVPIIMLTGSGSPEQVREGIEAGVFYYLTKPVNDPVLRSVVSAAIKERKQKRLLASQMKHQGGALRTMKMCQLEVKTLQQAENVACFLAVCFPAPERVVTGLIELLINAVEHGNLGITYQEKEKLLAEGNWQAEIERRLNLPEYQDRIAEATFQRKPEGLFVQITDSGEGFDWRKYWQVDPARATASNGRGIARARLMAFDRIAYNDKGNQVTAGILTSKENTLRW